MHAELTLELGLVVNEKRVARLMRQAGIQGLYRRRRRGCTVRDPQAESAGDLVNRRFVADAPNRLWLTDITAHPTDEGKLYCAAVMDVWSRRIVGWSIAPHIRTELVLDALGMAVVRRTPRKEKQFCIQTTARNTHRGPSGNGCRELDYWARWAASETATTTP